MIQIKPILRFLSLAAFVVFISCSGGQKNTEQTQTSVEETTPQVEVNAEAKLLLKTLNEMGDYANSRNFPSLIKPSSVYEELDGNIYVIDLRNEEAFNEGHIKGAVSVDFSDLPAYLTNDIKPFEYDKIVLVCYAGQIASYATSLLRLAGYGNVYAMRWGMSGWNKHFAEDSWLAKVSSDFQEQLETEDHDKAPLADLPKLNTGKASGDEILQQRINALFAAGYADALVYASDVFADPGHFYTINYDRKDKYDSGHIPGAVRYKPGGTLGIVSEMQTIPVDKEVVLYCNTGHNSGFATAYLRLFGYDAKTLTYGNNAFMYDKMKEEESALSWLPFTEAEIHDYPYVQK
ncbi:rhodanese-like domain-containing protein [Draconibacterium sp. IB214405]|uniref:rhodanese-like domain-containing protein n=1 Tax=Draconibacterium sp. IB214405 TaxID=3097352 RepID=UPI002A0F65A7|nr:rhodanese-like domain-containing protein [Draconibacterium sp. IB214405]MDX8338111.1 rhodanese-like domain-containing protein [Draconibacterium sp. IB214405]